MPTRGLGRVAALVGRSGGWYEAVTVFGEGLLPPLYPLFLLQVEHFGSARIGPERSRAGRRSGGANP